MREYRDGGSWCWWIRTCFWQPSRKDGAHEKSTSCFENLGFGCVTYDIALELVWVPTCANPADVPSRNKPIESWYASLPKLPSLPTAVFASAHTAGEHVRKLESSIVRKCNLPMLGVKLRGWPTLAKATPRPRVCGSFVVRASKTIGRTKRQTGRLIGPTLYRQHLTARAHQHTFLSAHFTRDHTCG